MRISVSARAYESCSCVRIHSCFELLHEDRRRGREGRRRAAHDAPAAVSVVKASRADLAGDLALTAEFEPFQQVDVMAKVAGYIRSIRVDAGDRVHEGQLLATLEIPEMEDDLTKAAAVIDESNAEIATASNELRRAEEAYALAHLSYTRIADVIKREPGLVPQQEVDEAHSRDLMAELQIATAKSRIRAAEQKARVAQADQTRFQTLHKYMTISAPFEGVVTKRYANVGSMIQAGTASQTQAMPIVQLSQNNLLRLILPVPESAVARVRVGETVEVRVSSLGKTFPGRVARFADKIQPSTRTMDTEVDVANPSLTLIPGMYAEVSLRVDERQNVLSVPLDAVDRSGPEPRVYTVVASGVIRIAPVKLGLESGQRVEVESGLQEGDAVVVGRPFGPERWPVGAGEDSRSRGALTMSRFAIRTPYLIVVVCLVIVLVGVVSVLRMPVDLFPGMNIPVVAVATFYSGMPPEQIEGNITYHLERFFTLASGIEHMESRSLSGVSLIKVYFQPGTNPDSAVTTIASLAAAEISHLAAGNVAALRPENGRLQSAGLPGDFPGRGPQRNATEGPCTERRAQSVGGCPGRRRAAAFWRKSRGRSCCTPILSSWKPGS